MTENVVYKFGVVNKDKNFILELEGIRLYIGMSLEDLVIQFISYNKHKTIRFNYSHDTSEVSYGGVAIFRVKKCKRYIQGFKFYTSILFVNSLLSTSSSIIDSMCSYCIGSYKAVYVGTTLQLGNAGGLSKSLESLSLKSLEGIKSLSSEEYRDWEINFFGLLEVLEKQNLSSSIQKLRLKEKNKVKGKIS